MPVVTTRRDPGCLGGAGVLVTFGSMATSRSRGSSGSRGGRTGTVGSNYYNDESPDVILPTPPPGRPGAAERGAARGREGHGQVAARVGAGRSRRLGQRARHGRRTGGGRREGRAGPRRARRRQVRRRGGSPVGRGKSSGRRSKARSPLRRRRRGAGKRAAPPSQNLLIVLTAWLFRAIAMAWLVVAGLVGGIVRRFGRNARDLHPDHKRDGIGLLFLGLAIVFAAAVWARMDNLALDGVYNLTSGFLGDGAFTVPVHARAGRLAVHASPGAEHGEPARGDRLDGPADRRARAVHIAKGMPNLSHGGGWPAVRTAGGLIGYAVSAPLVARGSPHGWRRRCSAWWPASGCSYSLARRCGRCRSGCMSSRSCSATRP